MTLFNLSGKKAFITGASRGIGQEIAVAFAEAGADLALVARSEDGLAATAEKAAGYGREAFVIRADVTDQEAVEGAVATAIERLGQVDIVVNNAGGSNFTVPFKNPSICLRYNNPFCAPICCSLAAALVVTHFIASGISLPKCNAQINPVA